MEDRNGRCYQLWAGLRDMLLDLVRQIDSWLAFVSFSIDRQRTDLSLIFFQLARTVERPRDPLVYSLFYQNSSTEPERLPIKLQANYFFFWFVEVGSDPVSFWF
jgi:hypothetical protein